MADGTITQVKLSNNKTYDISLPGLAVAPEDINKAVERTKTFFSNEAQVDSTIDTLIEIQDYVNTHKNEAVSFTSHIGNKDNPHEVTVAQIGALPISGGTITGSLGVNGKITQGTTSSDSTVSSMNRLQSDLYVQGDGSAPNAPRVAGFYLGKSTTDDNRHMDIVSGSAYSYIDFNQAGAEVDYNVRLIANVESGFTEFQWGGSGTDRTLNVAGTLKQAGQPVATQEWADGRYYTESESNSRFVNIDGDTMTGNFLIEKANPYVGFKDTGYSTMWYMQAYQDQFGFGPSWTNAVKSDVSGNMTVPGTVQGKLFKTDTTDAAIKPSDSNEISFGSNANYIYIGYDNRIGSTGAVDTYKFGTHSGVDGATSGNIECGSVSAGRTVKVGNAVTLQYNSSNACLDFIF